MKKNTRDILLDAATIVFSKNPGAPLSDVAEAANVGRATLYRYFPSRENLIRELTIESYQQTRDALAPVLDNNLPGQELLLAILQALIPLGDRYYFLLQESSFENDPEIQEMMKQDENDWYQVFEYMKDEGVIAADVSTAWVVATLEALIYAAWSSVHDGYVASREAPKLVYRTFISGLGSK